MWRLAQAAAPFLLVLLTAAPAQSADQILFVKGRIAEAEYLNGLPATGTNHGAPFIEGGDYRTKLVITEVLIGQSPKPDLYLTLTITAAPQGDSHPEIFLLAKQTLDGQLEPLDWDYAANGVCIGGAMARSYGIEDAIRAIEEKYPCQ